MSNCDIIVVKGSLYEIIQFFEYHVIIQNIQTKEIVTLLFSEIQDLPENEVIEEHSNVISLKERVKQWQERKSKKPIKWRF